MVQTKEERAEYSRNYRKNNPLTPKQKQMKTDRTKRFLDRNPNYMVNYRRDYYKDNSEKWINSYGKTKLKNNRSRKQFILDLLGGECVICGYNRCNKAIDFHETEKIDKKRSPSRMLESSTTFQVLLDNIDKITPLCSNCHREHHAGLIELPEVPRIQR